MTFLSSVPLIAVDAKHKLHEKVVQDFQVMQKAALGAGVSMNIASSFRPVERQLLIWNEKWQGKRTVNDRSSTPIDMHALSDDEKLKAILIWSALPGASRHHWGTDLDVYDAKSIAESGQPLALVEAEYQAGGPCFRLREWMDEHLDSFGFYCPYAVDKGGVAVEPWHISHTEQSQLIEQSLSKSEFARFIGQLEIEGRDAIIRHLDWIWRCFVLNRGDT